MRARQSGMTLIEVTVASVIFSMIMLATVTAFRTFAGTYARLEVETARTMQMREADRFLRETLRNAVNRSGFFRASRSSVQWVAPLDRVGGVVGLQQLRLVQLNDKLMLSFAPLGRADEAPAWDAVTPAFPLVENLDRVRFYYRSTAHSEWVAELEGEGANPEFPNAIALEIVSGGQPWPPLVVQFDQHRASL